MLTAPYALVPHRSRYADTGRFLHWNFVSILLSDLFGIQARGGCLCAGPYGHTLLGISDEAAEAVQELLLQASDDPCAVTDPGGSARGGRPCRPPC